MMEPDHTPKRVITRNGLAATAAERWHQAYNVCGAWCQLTRIDTKEIHDKLVALGPSPEPADVDQVIGNGSWTEIACDECGKTVNAAVILSAPDRHAIPVYVCQDCTHLAADTIDKENPNGP